MKILVFCPQITSRVRYLMHYVFRYRMKTDLCLTTHESDLRLEEGIKINYSLKRITREELFIQANALLFETDQIRDGDPDCVVINNNVKIFPNPGGEGLSSFDFDPFAAIFYMISRYEEYQSYTGDSWGRFSGSDSLACRYRFLDIPVVEIWVENIREKIESQFFVSLKNTGDSFRIKPTIDIDSAFAFQNRPFFYIFPRVIKHAISGNGDRAKMIWNAWKKKVKDPYDAYDLIVRYFREHETKIPVIFTLMSNHSKLDDGSFTNSKAFKRQIESLAKDCEIGIHPSVSSYLSLSKVNHEKGLLSNMTHGPVESSRQHFLLLKFPESYRILVKSGISRDFSMGFADSTGFRAGTCFPFPWYDLDAEEQSTLWVHPFQIMDVTLKKYMNLNPETASAHCARLKNEVLKYKGEFCFIWHNSSFHSLDGWEGWEKVFASLLFHKPCD